MASPSLTQVDAKSGSTVARTAAAVAAGAATISVMALAYYAAQRVGVDPTFVVDPDQLLPLADPAQTGDYAKAVIKGMSQVHQFMADVVDKVEGTPTVADVLHELAARGVDPSDVRSAVQEYARAASGSGADKLAERLLDPQAVLSNHTQQGLTAAIWAHDKRAAIAAAGIDDTLKFSVQLLGLAAAATVGSVASKTQLLTRAVEYVVSAGRRAAVDLGLLAPERQQAVDATFRRSFDPQEARARLAADTLARQRPAYRAYTSAWRAAAEMDDQVAMLQLFGLEPQTLGRRTEYGRAVMIDSFDAATLRSLAAREPDFAEELRAMADTRANLERKGQRPREAAPAVQAPLEVRIADLTAETAAARLGALPRLAAA